MWPPDAGEVLLAMARAAIGERWGIAAPPHSDAGWLHQPGAAFVTLALHGELKGCIGTIRPHRTLAQDVAANAVSAAFHDLRFQPLTREEFDVVRIEVSVLSPLELLSFADEASALAMLRPGIDGVLFEHGRHRATFLPQMWARFREPRTLLGHLKVKAGLPAAFWDADVRLFRYTVTCWHEAASPPAAPAP